MKNKYGKEMLLWAPLARTSWLDRILNRADVSVVNALEFFNSRGSSQGWTVRNVDGICLLPEDVAEQYIEQCSLGNETRLVIIDSGIDANRDGLYNSVQLARMCVIEVGRLNVLRDKWKYSDLYFVTKNPDNLRREFDQFYNFTPSLNDKNLYKLLESRRLLHLAPIIDY